MNLNGVCKNQELLEKINYIVHRENPVYLVGGAIRDFLLGKVSNDLDFVVGNDLIKTARAVAEAVGGAFYVMDTERLTARVIYQGQERFILDFAQMRGNTIDEDLQKRDFTINAIGLDIKNPRQLLDPLSGAQDLHDKVLRSCNSEAFLDDPLRILRAIRLAFQIDLTVEKKTLEQLKNAVPNLTLVSVERIRDELFRILEGKRIHSSVRTLELLGVLDVLFPELIVLKKNKIPTIPEQSAWNITLSTLRHLELFFCNFSERGGHTNADNLICAVLISLLGKYRSQINQHYSKSLAGERRLRAIILLAAIYLGFGEIPENADEINGYPEIYPIDHKTLTLFFKNKFALSLNESERLSTILRYQTVLDNMAEQILQQNRRAIFRYFKLTGEAGLDIGIIKLSQFLSIYQGSELGEDLGKWVSILDILFDNWWEKQDETIHPPRFINGNDLEMHLGINPGPVMGVALSDLEEAQAAGEVHNREEAISFINNWKILHEK